MSTDKKLKLKIQRSKLSEKLNKRGSKAQIGKLRGEELAIDSEVKEHVRKNKWLRLAAIGFSLILHIAFITVLFYGWRPMAEWYLGKMPIRGIDFYNTVTYVRFLRDNLVMRYDGWKDIWFSGAPLASDYPGLHFYLMQPLVEWLGLIHSVQYYMLGSIFLFGVFSYLLFWQVSKIRSLALVLALAVVYSVSPYGALVWGGSLPFFATQMFYPLAVYFLVRYLEKGNRRWFYLSALTGGIAVYGHPIVPMIYLLPTASILILFWVGKERKFFSLGKVKDLAAFVLLIFAVSYIEIRYLLGDVVRFTFGRFASIFQMVIGDLGMNPYNTELNVAAEGSTAEAEFARNQLASIITQTNQTIFIFLVFSALAFTATIILRRRKLGFFRVMPVLLLALYLVGYIALYAFGIPFFHGGWYRTFWAVPVIFGFLAAFLAGEARSAVGERMLPWFSKSEIIGKLAVVVLNIAILASGAWVLQANSQEVYKEVDRRGIASSAFPDRLNILGSDEELSEIKEKLIPSWVEGDDKNVRMYTIDATVNIWWNSLYDMPLARGYIDPPLTTAERWGLFWLDSVMSVGAESNRSSLEIDWEVPSEVVDENTKFLLDWYAVRFLEGNHSSTGNSLFAQHITSDEFVNKRASATVSGYLKRYETKSGEEEWDENGKQSLNYFRIKKSLTSPIVSASRVPVVLLIGSDTGYDTLMRYLGQVNFNSQKIILVKGPKFIDEVSLSDLTGFDGVVLYEYDYRKYSKAWAAIEGFVKNGGSLFVDTGVEVKESDSINLPARFPRELPAVFPVIKTMREDLGKEWIVEIAEHELTKGVKFSDFSRLDFDGEAWNISHPTTGEEVEEKAEVILKLKGHPVVVKSNELGGEVIWSGLNLPYHIIREHNNEEAEFLANIFEDLYGVGKKIARPDAEVEWVSPQEILVKTSDAKGVLVKEQGFPGWEAVVDAGGRKDRATIHLTGPSSPGFMYVKTPESGPVSVRFRYKGDRAVRWISFVSAVVVLYLLDAILFDKKILHKLTLFLRNKLRQMIRIWWKKDDYE